MDVQDVSTLERGSAATHSVPPRCPACGDRMRLQSLRSDPAHPYRLPTATFSCRCMRRTVMPWRPEGRHVVPAAGEDDELRRDFAVTTSPCGKQRDHWRWDIERMSTPLGFKFYDDGFVSEAAARLAGEKALRVFLEGLMRELKAADR
jgi:hypothetical protein